MRIFWLLLALLVGGGIAAWYVESGDAPAATARTAEHEPTREAPRPAPPAAAPAPAPLPATSPAPRPAPPAASNAPTANADHGTPSTRLPVEVVDPRTLRLDGRFEVLGRGSVEDPFRINWETLGSAIDAIDPIAGSVATPKWLEPLDGAWVELSGYFAPVTKLEESKELLFTKNRWDGCCIGLPPTVYDSIALGLEQSITLTGQHLIRFGTIRGQLHIEPYAAGGMMLGLYRVEHGTITTQPGAGG